MNEDRLITLILWVVFIFGMAGLAGTYYVRSYHPPGEIPPAIERHAKLKLPPKPTQGPPPISVPAPKTTVTSLKEGPKKGPPTTTSTPLLPQLTIHELSKANGAFSNAQAITEGVIIGSRGNVRDHADCYKVQAVGHTMVLKLDPSLKEETHYFTVVVFDSEQRPVGEILGNIRSTTIIPVKPQSIYYIKVDLSHAPIKKPLYKVHVNFSRT